MIIGNVRTFPFENLPELRDQATKVLEEAAEVFSACERYRYLDKEKLNWYRNHSYELCPEYRNLLDECADVIMAICNLLSLLRVIDFSSIIDECEKRNSERGRYDIQESDQA